MDILYLLVPVALVFFVIAIRFLYWAVKNGQYDDLNTESRRILFDDDAGSGTPEFSGKDKQQDD